MVKTFISYHLLRARIRYKDQLFLSLIIFHCLRQKMNLSLWTYCEHTGHFGEKRRTYWNSVLFSRHLFKLKGNAVSVCSALSDRGLHNEPLWHKLHYASVLHLKLSVVTGAFRILSECWNRSSDTSLSFHSHNCSHTSSQHPLMNMYRDCLSYSACACRSLSVAFVSITVFVPVPY